MGLVPDPGLTGWVDLGDVAVVPVVEQPVLPISPAEFFPGLRFDPDAWYAREPWIDTSTGAMPFVIQSFLVCDNDTAVLIDACVGSGKSRRRPEFDHLPQTWLENLAATGVTTAGICDVVLTHLHVDHVGGVTRWEAGAWVPAFPRARHHVARAELEHWSGPKGASSMERTGDYMADSIAPLAAAGLLDVVDDERALGSHIRLRPAPGHTPGNLLVEVEGSRGTVLIGGDVLHHPVQIAHPDISTAYCVDAPEAVHARHALLSEAAVRKVAIVPSHFPTPSIGRVAKHDQGFFFTTAQDLLGDHRFYYPRWRTGL